MADTIYNIFEPWKTLDPWQKKYIETEGNCFLLCGRQSGKTTAMSVKFGDRAAKKPKQIIMMIAYTEKQAYNLFFKTLMYLRAVYPGYICTGDKKPTKHEIHLKNGSLIMCYAAGLAGEGLRTYTLTSLVIDEAAPMAREVFIATTPMLSVTGGTMDVSSTPRGKQGYFYECSKKDNFTKFYVSAEDCPRHTREYLDSEKEAMSELEYAQEYLAKFLDDLKRIFNDDWLKKVCVLKRPSSSNGYFSMGVDIARMGDDESTFEILDHTDYKYIRQVENMVTKKTLTTETEDKIIELSKQYHFKRIYIDAGSGTLGVGVLDHLLKDSETKNKVIALNSRKRVQDRFGKKTTKILNEDMYDNLKKLGERGHIKLLDDKNLMESLASVQYEYLIKKGRPTSLRIFGRYTHIAEGLIRAAWCVKDKSLNIWIRYS